MKEEKKSKVHLFKSRLLIQTLSPKKFRHHLKYYNFANKLLCDLKFNFIITSLILLFALFVILNFRWRKVTITKMRSKLNYLNQLFNISENRNKDLYEKTKKLCFYLQDSPYYSKYQVCQKIDTFFFNKYVPLNYSKNIKGMLNKYSGLYSVYKDEYNNKVNYTLPKILNVNGLHPIKHNNKSFEFTNIAPREDILMNSFLLYKFRHLKGNFNFMKPKIIHASNKTSVWLTMAIATVQREGKSYLVDTVASLIDGQNINNLQTDCLILILFAEPIESDYVNIEYKKLKTKFPTHFASGLLELISPPPEYYPVFSSLTPTLGDSMERNVWRTKQNLDYIFLMNYARNRGKYYMQLEDDIIASGGYLAEIKEFLETKNHFPWFVIEFSNLGFIAKVFSSSNLVYISEFLTLFYNDKPGDWLLDSIITLLACGENKYYEDCYKSGRIKELRIRHKPSLFQHIGSTSSLKGKKQLIIDKDFSRGKISLIRRVPNNNPKAVITTSMVAHAVFPGLISLQNVYDYTEMMNISNYYWAYNPKAGDYVNIFFYQTANVSEYKFVSGHTDHPSDMLFNTTLEIKLLYPHRKHLVHENISKINFLNCNYVPRYTNARKKRRINKFNDNFKFEMMNNNNNINNNDKKNLNLDNLNKTIKYLNRNFISKNDDKINQSNYKIFNYNQYQKLRNDINNKKNNKDYFLEKDLNISKNHFVRFNKKSNIQEMQKAFPESSIFGTSNIKFEKDEANYLNRLMEQDNFFSNGLENKTGHKSEYKNNIDNNDFIPINCVDKSTGILVGRIPVEWGPLTAMRLQVRSNSTTWVILREITIKE